MAKDPSQEAYRRMMQGTGVAVPGDLRRMIQDNSWADEIGIGRPLTKSEISALAQSGYWYDEEQQTMGREGRQGRSR